jgi:hypothetical protein
MVKQYALSVESDLGQQSRRIHGERVTMALHAPPLRVCTVGFKAATGISHSVEVQAESLYEAAAMGLPTEIGRLD